MPGKKRARQDDVAPELDARHVDVQREIEADYVAAASALGFTRRAFVYWMATAYDMAVDEIADGFKVRRVAHLDRLVGHIQANLTALVNFPAAEGSVIDSDQHDRDDPDHPGD